MPLYEYECSHCHHRFEKIESFSASEKKECPKCGKVAKRVLAPSAIQFKGSGWYVTDYAKKGSSPASTTASADKPAGASAEKGTAGKASADKKD
ncbi:MAG: zinc ribbon domain-containing protein [Acidobacteriota bacterium]|nr:zinc ribbon domain-containing protein [Acidobacteriota bacterium]